MIDPVTGYAAKIGAWGTASTASATWGLAQAVSGNPDVISYGSLGLGLLGLAGGAWKLYGDHSAVSTTIEVLESEKSALRAERDQARAEAKAAEAVAASEREHRQWIEVEAAQLGVRLPVFGPAERLRLMEQRARIFDPPLNSRPDPLPDDQTPGV